MQTHTHTQRFATSKWAANPSHASHLKRSLRFGAKKLCESLLCCFCESLLCCFCCCSCYYCFSVAFVVQKPCLVITYGDIAMHVVALRVSNALPSWPAASKLVRTMGVSFIQLSSVVKEWQPQPQHRKLAGTEDKLQWERSDFCSLFWHTCGDRSRHSRVRRSFSLLHDCAVLSWWMHVQLAANSSVYWGWTSRHDVLISNSAVDTETLLISFRKHFTSGILRFPKWAMRDFITASEDVFSRCSRHSVCPR